MLTIRLARVGKRNKAQFKIVLQERTIAPGGRHAEILGSYDPHQKVALLKEERIKYWVGKGAYVSDTAHNLFVSKGIISGKKRAVKIPAKKVEETKPEEKSAESVKKEEGTKEGTGEGTPASTPEAAKTEEKPKEEAKKEASKKEEKK